MRADRWATDSKTISRVCLKQDQCWCTKSEGWQLIIGFIRQTPSQGWWVTPIAGGGILFQGSDGWSSPASRGMRVGHWEGGWSALDANRIGLDGMTRGTKSISDRAAWKKLCPPMKSAICPNYLPFLLKISVISLNVLSLYRYLLSRSYRDECSQTETNS